MNKKQANSDGHKQEECVEEDEINLIELFQMIWSQRWLIVKITSVFFILSLIYVLSLDNIYKASVTMLPQIKENRVSKFSSIAALAGINLNSAATSNEAFYEDVLKSDKVLDKLISRRWFAGREQKEEFLYDFLEIKEDENHFDPKGKLFFDTKKYLREKAIKFTSSEENGLMTLSVSMPLEPKLSADIANWLAKELHEFNESYRQNKALETVKTVKKQVDEAKIELTNAEDKLNRFQRRNQNYLQSSELKLEYARLQREVAVENAVYTELRKQFEIAKIDLEKSKETITILDTATAPVLKDEPKRSKYCIFITLFGIVLSIVIVLVKDKLNYLLEK